MPKFRAKKVVRKLVDCSDGLLDINMRAANLTSLVGFSYLDQRGRSRRQPTRPTAKRIISTKNAKRVRLLALARLQDRIRRQDPASPLKRKLLNRVFKHGDLSHLADGPSIDVLIAAFKANEKEVRHVVLIVDYLLRSRTVTEKRVPLTIEDAKAFVCKWIDEFSPGKIAQIWENYKLVAPYLYALSLEPSFRPSKANHIDNILDWALCFVANPRRIARFLGHAAFAMDVLKGIARDQRESDFYGVDRVVPMLRRFDDQENFIIDNLDRNGPIA
jgi:hypothetical protein